MNEEELKEAVQTVMYWAVQAANGIPGDRYSPAGEAWHKLERWIHPEWMDEEDEDDE